MLHQLLKKPIDVKIPEIRDVSLHQILTNQTFFLEILTPIRTLNPESAINITAGLLQNMYWGHHPSNRESTTAPKCFIVTKPLITGQSELQRPGVGIGGRKHPTIALFRDFPMSLLQSWGKRSTSATTTLSFPNKKSRKDSKNSVRPVLSTQSRKITTRNLFLVLSPSRS